MNYKEALAYLDSFFNLEKIPRYNYSRELKLDRMRELLKKFDNPQDEFKAIHIAGSKGKGTVAVTLYQILKDHGYKVGLYTSPHLLTLRERIRFSKNKTADPLNFGDTISEEELIELVEEIRPKLEDFSKNSQWRRPTFFEIYTLLAFLYFTKKNVDFAVIETGLGGRLDATNTVRPILTAITKILFEHTDKLGKTIKEIANEKAGIMKDGVPCVIGLQKWQEALKIFKNKAKQIQAPLLTVGKDVKLKKKNNSFSVNVNDKVYNDLKTNLLGSFQYENLAVVVVLTHLLKELFYNLDEKKIRQALLNIYWPGRYQIVKENPLIILDSAHTPESVEILGRELKYLYPEKRIITILGISKDKDKEGIIRETMRFSEEVIFSYIDNPRLANPEQLHSIAQKISRAKSKFEWRFRDLLTRIHEYNKKGNLFLITGSIFLIAEAIRFFRHEPIHIG